MTARIELSAIPLPSRVTTAQLEESYARCREVARTHSKTFYFASMFMPNARRRAIWAIYAFCRTADNLVDSLAPSDERVRGLDAWHDELVAAYEGRPRDPLMIAFADSAARFAVPIAPALDLIAGARRDVSVLRYESYAELLEYCYLVAGTVGLLTSPVLGYRDGALAYGVALGRAMQMTNILRDVGEDARLGRIYLPLEDLRRFHYTEDDLFAGVLDERFVALMRFQIARVREMYAQALPGIALLSPSSRPTVRVALALYRRILDEIERNGYDVFTKRAYVPMRDKLLVALGGCLAPLR